MVIADVGLMSDDWDAETEESRHLWAIHSSIPIFNQRMPGSYIGLLSDLKLLLVNAGSVNKKSFSSTV